MPKLTSKQLFQQFYNAALSNSENTIKQLLLNGSPIDIEEDGYTAAQALAMSGDLESVLRLKKYGAKWNCIVLGFIEGKHYHHAEAMIEEERLKSSYPNRFYDDENPATQIAYELAKKGWADSLLKLLLRYEEIVSSYCANIAIENGHQALAETLRLPPYDANIHWIAMRAAQRGLFDYCQHLLIAGALPEFIARGAAMFGAFDEVEKLRQYAITHNKPFCRNAMLAGEAAFAGHFDYAEKLLNEAPETEKKAIAENIMMLSKNKHPVFHSFFCRSHPIAPSAAFVEEATEKADNRFDCA